MIHSWYEKQKRLLLKYKRFLTMQSGTENFEHLANLSVNHVSYSYDEDKLVLSILVLIWSVAESILWRKFRKWKDNTNQIVNGCPEPRYGDICWTVPITQKWVRLGIPCSATFIFNALSSGITLRCFAMSLPWCHTKVRLFLEILTEYPDGINHMIDR